MKVKGLIKRLQLIEDQNQEIYIASDAEGNGFHSIDEVAEIDNTIVIWPNHDDIEIGE